MRNIVAKFVAVGLCLAAGIAVADVTGRWQVNLIRGSTTLEQLTGATEAEAWSRCVARIDVLSDTANINTVFACQTMRYYGTTIAPLPPPVRQAVLSWTPPTTNTDGSPLSNLAGYRISYGTSATALAQTIPVPSASARSYTVNNLAPGTYYFAVRAYRTDGAESVQSNIGSKVVQ